MSRRNEGRIEQRGPNTHSQNVGVNSCIVDPVTGVVIAVVPSTQIRSAQIKHSKEK